MYLWPVSRWDAHVYNVNGVELRKQLELMTAKERRV